MTRRHPAVREPAFPYAAQAIDSLRSWPALAPAHHDNGVVFTAEDREIVRFNGRGTAHLHLTRPVLDRLMDVLAKSVHLGLATEPGWVVISLEDSMDLHALLALVSVAIKANAEPPAEETVTDGMTSRG
ncbi:luciferase family protein [Nonomuraea jiangxiensis]|uniref:luciferase domain-containing protein n=1 Tax=Nonomuraea jiangxiensis TaxID=633440 RepID=UPI001C409C58|nr:luciferase family protein [Nonomuraea jiangxiensis]